MNLKKSLSTTFLGLILTIIIFISCNIFDHVYDNQTDPQYDGEGKYSLILDNAYSSIDTVSVLTDLNFTVEDKGLDNHWYSKIVITTDPIDTSIFRFSIDSTQSHIFKISLFFADTFSGRLVLNATRPNGLIDSSFKEIKVINPFTIAGKQMAGIGDTVRLKIEPYHLLTNKNSHTGILWSLDSAPSEVLPFDKPFEIFSNSFVTLSVNASIFRDEDTIILKPGILTFNGHSPQIDSAKLLEPLRIGEAPRVLIWFSDIDEGNTISFEITVNENAEEVTFEPSNKPGTGVITFKNIISDIKPKTIGLKAIDNTGLSSESFTFDPIEVLVTPPEVKFINSDSLFLPPMNSAIYLATRILSGDPVRYKWTLDNIELTSEQKSFLILDSRTDTAKIHTVTVQCFDRFDIPGPVATLKFRVAPYRFTVSTVPGSSLPAMLKVNQQYTLTVRVMDTDQNILGNDSINYFISGLDTSAYNYTQSGPEIKITLKKEQPSFILTVNAQIGDEKIAAAPLSIAAATSRFAPTCKFVKPLGKRQEIYLDSTVLFQVKAEDTNDGGSVENIFYILNQGNIPDTISLGKNTEWEVKFRKKGTCRVIAFAVDNENNISTPDTITFDVKSEKPQFTIDSLDTTMTIKDTIYIHATLDYNYSVTYVWDKDNDGTYEDTTGNKDSIACYYDTTGTHIIRAQCLSELGDMAISAMVFTITVKEGKPVVKSIAAPDTTYPGKKETLKVSAFDNGSITEYLFSLDNGTFTSIAGNSLDTLFTTIGKHYIHVKVKDNIGLISEIFTDSVIVAHGEPRILKFQTSVTTSLIKENVTFSFTPFDPDGKVKMVCFNWDGKTTVQDSLQINYKPDSIYTFTKKFTVADSGSHKVYIWAVDDQNQKSLEPAEIVISVLSGKPVIGAVAPQEVWVKRDTMITIHASDTNGTIVMTWVDWNNDGNWDDSSEVAKAFPHRWDTLSGDRYSVFTAKVKDDDQLSVTKACSVFVKMGRPVIRGGENYGNTNTQWVFGNNQRPDTLFYVRQSGQPTYICFDTLDMNGQCMKYFWDWQNPDLVDDTTVVPYKTRDGLRLNDTNRVTVSCIDNDTIRSKPYSFFVFPDAPPPSDFQIGSKYLGDPTSFTILWEGLDIKDDSLTNVVMIAGTSLTSINDTLTKGFEPARNFSINGTYLGRTFNLQESGYNQNFYFRVILKDARGSTAEKTSTVIFYP